MTKQICVARIGAAHGVRGEVRLWTFTEDPLAVLQYGPLSTKDGARQIEVARARAAKDHLVATLKGVTTRDEAERLVERRHHGEVGDAVQRVEHVVADPADEAAVLVETQARGLLAQLAVGGAGPRDEEAHVAAPLDHAGERIEGDLEALLVDEPADEQHEALVRLGERRSERREIGDGIEVGRIDAVRDHRDPRLVEIEDVGHVTAHVVRADDDLVGGVGSERWRDEGCGADRDEEGRGCPADGVAHGHDRSLAAPGPV